MYVGRFVVVAPDRAAYRVSSRSFPDRRVVARDGALTVAPTPDAPETDNPYVSYNCVRTTSGGGHAVVGNGSQVDPIVEKLELGYPPRDALAEPLLALDYEKDDYDTPRIAGIVGRGPTGSRTESDDAVGEESYVGIVRRDALLVEAVAEPTLVATYERDRPEAVDLAGDDPASLAREVYEFDLEHPVCAAAVTRTGDGFETDFYNGD